MAVIPFNGFLDWLIPAHVHIDRTLKSCGITDVDACLKWAFGDDYSTMPVTQMDDAWNKLHEDIFMLFGHDLVETSLIRIAKACRMENHAPSV